MRVIPVIPASGFRNDHGSGTLEGVSGYANPDRPDQRLSDAERDAAVGHLAAAQSEGRLNPAEYQERVSAARVAVTRGDLVPLFADLPESTTAEDQSPRSSTAPAAAAGTLSPPPRSSADRYADDAPPAPPRGLRPLGGAVGATIMALVPILALGLFFLFGYLGSFAWSWLFFLLVPIAGIVIYGPGAQMRRSQR